MTNQWGTPAAPPTLPTDLPAPHLPPAVPPARRPTRRAAFVAAILAAGLIGGGAGAGAIAATQHPTSAVASPAASTAAISAKLDGTVAAAAAKITPSVVTIDVSGQSESGIGSGVVVKAGGYILTNDHVVDVAGNGGTITVVSADGRSASATIVGRDATDDLAVIKTSLTGLTVASFGSSSNLTVGQAVVAVGAPLGLSDTVTSGIVSSTARTVRSGDSNQAVFAAIQTDAAINPGNSGGPLVDLNGAVVGINAAIASTSNSGVTVPGQPTTQSGSIGIGFAIPADEASRVANELISSGTAQHAELGVTAADTSATASTGAVLKDVTGGSPAASAGLKVGDVVTAVNAARVSNADDLVAVIRSYAPGQSVTVHYTRGGSSATAVVKLGSAS